jgi:hypothetical protein
MRRLCTRLGTSWADNQSSRRRVAREQWAWHWARDNALVWTLAMERSACANMAYYEKKYAKQRNDPERDRCLTEMRLRAIAQIGKAQAS